MNNFIVDYVPYTQQPEPFRRGVLISSAAGVTAAYTLNTIQERGDLFIGNAVEVYEGMIIGINKFEQDLEVNPTKEREKSGVRRNQAEITQVALRPVIKLTLEFALVFLNKDEVLEITPHFLRLRKALLAHNERIWASRRTLSDFAARQMETKS